ncbi:hypothetical protein B6N60_04449 [Richelia sinica FACHB-800]|uniref:Uncharacterized protein n=1 Tax=Richelia sinica FACHB-800 TaxID=1357546 RepID=A0A975TBN6_9NOST|nr:hypothetical protein B6N60_04449 [Richelia sinica FACHB-800]
MFSQGAGPITKQTIHRLTVVVMLLSEAMILVVVLTP